MLRKTTEGYCFTKTGEEEQEDDDDEEIRDIPVETEESGIRRTRVITQKKLVKRKPSSTPLERLKKKLQ